MARTLADPRRQGEATLDPTAQIVRLQKKLAFSLLLGFLVPALVIIVLGVYALKLSSRLKEVEALEQINFIERFYKDARNVPWAIDRYNQLITTHKSPQVLARLGSLYFDRSRTGGNAGFNPDDVKLAKETLNEANQLSLKRGSGEFWEAFAILTYIELELALKDTDKNQRLERERKVIQLGEKALALSRGQDTAETYDAQTLNNLAWLYAMSENEGIRNLDKAKEYAQRAVELTRQRNSDYLDTLAEVRRREGRR